MYTFDHSEDIKTLTLYSFTSWLRQTFTVMTAVTWPSDAWHTEYHVKNVKNTFIKLKNTCMSDHPKVIKTLTLYSFTSWLRQTFTVMTVVT